jgi:hypothetical protein
MTMDDKHTGNQNAGNPAADPARTLEARDNLDGRHDFDFLHGHWHIQNERLRERLVGSQDWEIFPATHECRPLLDGLGNVEGFHTAWDGGFEGMALRLFDEADDQWRIWWASDRSGQLDPPVTGGFRDGVGTFFGHDTHAGRPVRVRFTWEQTGPHAAHWQQAFSTDEGASWETNWHMRFRRVDGDGRLVHDDAVVELRQYTLQAGKFDALACLFEAEFIEPQEAVGMHVIGQFRDLDDPDRFVWLRGFPSLPARRAALEAFYGGPVWQGHRSAANATMVDSDNVLLLRPSADDAGLAAARRPRPAAGETREGDGAFGLGVCALAPGMAGAFAERFAREWAPQLRDTGAQLLATYVTHAGPNTYPRLPVREGEEVFVWLLRLDDLAALDGALAALRDAPAWREAVAAALLDGLESAPQWLRLAPTPRSELR